MARLRAAHVLVAGLGGVGGYAAEALGRVCAMPTVSCPPAIPIVVSGEVIGPAALELFAAYGVETVSVVKSEKF